MGDRISGRQFLDSDGVDDWRVIWGGGWACAFFRTSSYREALSLVAAIGNLATDADRRPDVDLRPDGVTVRLYSGEWEGLTTGDAEIARQISEAARAFGAEAEPRSVQHVQVAIDAMVIPAVLPFWRAVLGYHEVGEEDLFDDRRRGPSFWFQQMDAPRAERGRIHVDVYVPHDEAERRLAAAVAAGGRIVRDNGPEWWTLADAEGNEADLAIWMAP
jgi:4a-hydroxytetrahydrobiopterin dehydratase